ncbi:MAG: hypothetical protein EBT63_06650, partial [Proteobacteria bacterium]|nr:hypothetical protein [Pseudomonadota bacterium]
MEAKQWFKINKKTAIIDAIERSIKMNDFKSLGDVYSKIIMNAFHKKPLEETLVLLHDEFNRLCNNTVSAKDLTISKSIGEIKDYK